MAAHFTGMDEPVPSNESSKTEYKTKIIWFNVIFFIFLHGSLLYGVYLGLMVASWKTLLFAYVYRIFGELGATAGSHRLWSHRSYKAKWPLRALLCVFASIAAQNDIYDWCRKHRVHHKFSETDADPHNIKRGFFFSHIGWLMCNIHPDVAEKGKTISMDDVLDDPIVIFHRRFYIPMSIFFCYILPTMIPALYWNETIRNSFFIAGMAGHCFQLNSTWLVNSAAHTYGDQPYYRYLEARENTFVAFLTHGEGWHNFHHAFPWDYSASEWGYTLNFTKVFIDFMASIGQAYDLKSAHPEMVKRRKLKTGNISSQKLDDKTEQLLY